MSNNLDENVKTNNDKKNNRFNLSLSSTTSSFDFKNNLRNPYSHLEYYQKIEKLLSDHQTVKTDDSNKNKLFENQKQFNSVNVFDFHSFRCLTNNEIFKPNNFNNNNSQSNINLPNSKRAPNPNNHENLISFDTNDDINVLDIFDPLKNINFYNDEQKIKTKSVESLNKLNEIEKIQTKKITENLNQEIKQDICNEISDFIQRISQLKKPLDLNKKQNPKLIVYSSIVEFQLSKFKNLNINLNIRYYSDTEISKRYIPIRILVSFNSNIETILYQVLNLYKIEELDVSKYFLKIHGLEEYLPLNVCIAEIKYFYDCINENKEPVLILVCVKKNFTPNDKLNSLEKKQLQHDFSIESLKIDFNLKAKIENVVRKIVVGKTGLQESLRNEIDTDNLDRILDQIKKLVESIYFLKSLLFEIGHNLIEDDLFKLNCFINKLDCLLNINLISEKEPLITSKIGYSYSVSNSSDHVGIELIDSINILLKRICNNVYSFIKCAYQSFYSDFNLETISNLLSIKNNQKIGKTLEVIQADSKLVIYFKGISRLDNLVNKLFSNNSTINLSVKFSIVYGSNVLDSVILRLDKIDKNSQKKIDHFVKTIKIQFDRMDLCLIPREACLLVQLFNSNSSNFGTVNMFNQFEKIDQTTSVVSSLQSLSFDIDDSNKKCISWASKTIFDYKLNLECTEYFLSMFDSMPESFSAYCCTISNIYSKKSPVVQIEFQSYDNNYKYPNEIYECECNLKDFQSLPNDLKDSLIEICNQSIAVNKMTQNQKDLINEYFTYLNGIPFSLSKVYLSLVSYDFSSIIHFYAYLKQIDPLSLNEAIELLLSYFPDQELRKHAVRLIESNNTDLVSYYLPQLLEALKYERLHYSDLALMLLRKANTNLKFAHRLYWHLREFKSRERNFINIRYDLLMEALKTSFDSTVNDEIEKEIFMIECIDKIGCKIKDLKDNERLQDELDFFQKDLASEKKLNMHNYRLPLNICYSVKEIDIKSCAYISSFTVPLKLVFKNSDISANSFYTIYKIGDDLRQDMFVIQMINVMKQLWLADDLDLNIITFECLQTGNNRGFIEMITDAETLKEIQKGAVMNAFKKSCINEWIKSHNPKKSNFKKAVENFTRSCAGYSIATYLLGIGDRHNDNIMIKYTGHMFHIDFGKYLGDAQTFAGFKRDRTPIIFTSDMFYVINQSKEPNFKFQEFIELCCQAFQILRKNHIHLLSIVELMINSGIPGLNKNAIQYIHRNLMIDLNEDESSNMLKKIIHDSLGKFASINFAIHTLAQPKTVSSSNYFSFVTHIFNSETDGKILAINLDRSELASSEDSKEFIKCNVIRESEFESNDVYRTFEEFCELYSVLCKTFTTLRLIETPSYNKFKETKQSLKRYLILEKFLKEIMSFPAEISQSEIIYTFFHSIVRDEDQQTFYSTDNENFICSNNDRNYMTNRSHEMGQVKLKLRFKENIFYVNCLQCRNLKPPHNQSVSSLKPYIKCYLRPDYTKSTKKKVQALFNGANPIFTETMEYGISLEELKKRTLELTVLNNRLNSKEKIGSIEIKLSDINWQSEFVSWYFLA